MIYQEDYESSCIVAKEIKKIIFQKGWHEFVKAGGLGAKYNYFRK